MHLQLQQIIAAFDLPNMLNQIPICNSLQTAGQANFLVQNCGQPIENRSQSWLQIE
jgi:hypothetical protein